MPFSAKKHLLLIRLTYIGPSAVLGLDPASPALFSKDSEILPRKFRRPCTHYLSWLLGCYTHAYEHCLYRFATLPLPGSRRLFTGFAQVSVEANSSVTRLSGVCFMCL